MPRRKQDCPKRMKWEGGEGAEEGASPDSPGSKVGADDASSSPMSPNSVASGGVQEEDVGGSLTPVGTAPASPATPSPIVDGTDADPSLAVALLHDPLAIRDTPSSRSPSRDSRDSPGSGSGPVAAPAGSPLLPPHTAALAAYLGAAAQQQHRLLTPGMPRGSVSPLVTSSSSPPMLPLAGGSVMSPPPVMETDSTVLDFSTKRSHVKSAREESEGDAALNLSKPPTPALPAEIQLNSPLDLSVSSRKRGLEDSSSMSLSLSSLSPSPHPPSRKNSRMSAEFKPVVSPWTSPVVASHFPYFAAAVAAASSLSPKNNTNSNHGPSENPLWNGKMKMHEKQSPHYGGVPTPSDATKALEKMSELSKLGGDDLFRPNVNSNVGSSNAGVGSTSSSRHSAWQSHWLNKGAEQAKDVLKCVWCKQSFPSLAAMTAHMKEAKHCGVNVPAPQIQPPPPPPPHQPPVSSPSVSANSSVGPPSSLSGSNKPSAADLNLLIKETMPLPRKLVRGQDVWLGKGAEQTRQILKCMWCGQSFRSLAEMTSHMQQTQHYTNIISQEQIISWKSADDNKTGGGPGGGAAPGGAGGASSHVSAVLTCKVCDQAFSSLKELSNHMVKNSHYKEHIMRSITESGGRRRQTREKRKKSLPVRKLLELERAQHELKNGEGGMIVSSGGKLGREPSAAGRITCEKCGEKIETSIFVDHIRQCVGGGSIGNNQRNLLKSALLSSNVLPPENAVVMGHIAEREGRKSIGEDPAPVVSRHHRSPSLATDLTTPSKETSAPASSGADSSSPSVLNAIEKLIEKSFDSRTRHGAAGGYGSGPGGPGSAPMGSSILKRLGIDESVDYTKPLVDAQTMNILRSYHHHHHNQQHHYNRRERSGSESSSVSDRGSGRPEALTPDRRLEPVERLMPSTPRTTPEKRIQTPPSAKTVSQEESVGEDIVKKEVLSEDDREELRKVTRREVVVKKEEVDEPEEEEDDRASFHSGVAARRRRTDDVPLTPASGVEDDAEEAAEAGRRSASSAGVASPAPSPRQQTPVEAVASSPCRNSSSPASSERSGTPRSSTGADKKSSLGALSSMFDSLSGGASGTTEGAGAGGRSTSSHPLAALQKLCDKTERHGGSSRSGAASSGGSGNHSSAAGAASSQSGGSSGGTAPGAILAFSWACNDAVMTADSIMKCAFCDTPFISKGAYRHHLSKMHFVKDGVIPDPVALKAQQGGSSSSGTAAGKGGSATPNSAVASISSGGAGSSGKSPQHPSNFEESPHSKFLKYTELAKQLSSKYV